VLFLYFDSSVVFRNFIPKISKVPGVLVTATRDTKDLFFVEIEKVVPLQYKNNIFWIVKKTIIRNYAKIGGDLQNVRWIYTRPISARAHTNTRYPIPRMPRIYSGVARFVSGYAHNPAGIGGVIQSVMGGCGLGYRISSTA